MEPFVVISEFPVVSFSLIIAGITFLGAIIGIIYHLVQLGKNRRCFRITGPEVEETDWTDTKEVRFQLLNDGEGTVIVKGMKLDVIDNGLSKNLRMVFPGAPIAVYNFRVELNHNLREYALVSKVYDRDKPLFSYKKGDIDSFIISLSSLEPYWYNLCVSIQWFYASKPQKIYYLKSSKFRIFFSPIQPNDIAKTL
jgi:hypothetical protein